MGINNIAECVAINVWLKLAATNGSNAPRIRMLQAEILVQYELYVQL